MGVVTAATAGLLVIPPATAAEPQPEQDPQFSTVPASYDAPLLITIDHLTPGEVPERGPVTVTGTVANRDVENWTGIRLYPFINAGVDCEALGCPPPITTTAGLVEAAESDPTDVVGARIPEVSATIDKLAPGEVRPYTIQVPRRLLPVTTPGVYWFGVHALGASDDVADDSVADGRARTFLPYIPRGRDGVKGKVDTAIVVPLRYRIRHLQDGRLAKPTSWEAAFDSTGDLGAPLEFGAAAVGKPVTWLIDPAVADAVRRLRRGNPPRDLGPDESDADGAEETPSDGASEETDETEEEEDPQTPVGIAAGEWLDSLEVQLRGEEVLALPYGDLDMSATPDRMPELYPISRERVGDVLSSWDTPTSPVIASPGGYLDPSAIDGIPDDSTLLITDRMFDPENYRHGPPLVGEYADHTIAATSYGAATGGPGPEPRLGAVSFRQRVLAEAAVRLVSPGRRHPLIVVVPRTVDSQFGGTFWSGLNAAWMNITTVADATDRPSTLVEPDSLTYPVDQETAELSSTVFSEAEDLIEAGRTLQNLLIDAESTADDVRDEALTGASYHFRTDSSVAAARLARSRHWIDRKLRRVRVDGPPAVTLSSADGTFAVTVTNELPRSVTVRLAADSVDDQVTIDVGDRIVLAAAQSPEQPSRTTIQLETHTHGPGVHNVTLVGHQRRRHATRLLGRGADPVRPGQRGDLGDHRRRRRHPLLRHRAPPVPPDPGPSQAPVGPGGRTDRGRRMTEALDTGGEQRGILANSAVMAAGTVVSRFSGLIRSILLASALGVGLHADLFTIANTVPNMLYILLAGGVFNAVLVPQLVRSMKNDSDGGSAYVDRIVTLAVLFLAAVTVLLVLAAPWVMDLLLDSKYGDPALAAERQSAIDFARFCLPQVFFYGMFVLVGQILNARGRFGPMMWAPIANNVIAVGVLVVYLVWFGAASEVEQHGAFTGSQEAWLGIGSTVGILAQFLILVPYLRAAGVRIRPRFDFRGTGLSHTLRLAVWTVLFVVVNQAAYVVVVRLASGGTAASDNGTGITIYSSALLVTMVPHSVITVSLATAILPRLSAHAAAKDDEALSRTLVSTIRTALVVAVPVALLMPLIALSVAQALFGHGAAAADYVNYEETLALFGIGIVFFTLHYLTLRGFYALELNRTVFLIQCVISAVNITVALVLVGRTDPDHTAAMLVIAYTAAYGVGSLISFSVLARRLGGLDVRSLLGFAARLLLASAIGVGAAWMVDLGLDEVLERAPGSDGWWWAAVDVAVLGTVALLVVALLARVLKLREVTTVIDTVTARLRRG